MLEFLVLCKKNNAFIPTVPEIITAHKKNLEALAAARKAKKANNMSASTSSSSLSAASPQNQPTLHEENEEDEDVTDVLLGFMFDQPTSWKFEDLKLTARQLNELERDYLPN